jgi:hypothetical protein
MRNKLHNNDTLAQLPVLQVGAVGSLLEKHIFSGRQVLPTNDGMAMGSSLSPFVITIFMEPSEKLALVSVQQNNCCGLALCSGAVTEFPQPPQ